MRKYLLNALIVFFLSLLVACQSNNMLSTEFNSSFTAPNANLDQMVQNALMRNEDPVIAQVHVQTQNDSAILSGYVKKIRQSDEAEQIARQVPGVRTVENHIIVRP